MRVGALQSRSAASTTGPHAQLIWPDGSVSYIRQAMTAAEALISSRKEEGGFEDQPDGNWKCAVPNINASLLCDSATLRVGKRACPVHPNTQLQAGHLFYVLPISAFQRRLRWSYIACLAATSTASSSSAVARQTLDRISLLKSYLTFLLSRKHCSRSIFTKLMSRRRVVDTDLAAHRSAQCDASLLLSQSMNGCGRRVFSNICDSPEAVSKYVEHLIDRSNSWRPPLLTINE